MGKNGKSRGNIYNHEDDSEIAPPHIFAEAVELSRLKLSVNWKCPKHFEKTVVEVMEEMGEKNPYLLIGQIEDLAKAVYKAKKNHDQYLSERNKSLKYVMGEIEKLTTGNKPPSTKDFPHGSIRYSNGDLVGKRMLAWALHEVQEKCVSALKKIKEDELNFEKIIRTKVERRFPGNSFIPPNFFENPIYCNSEIIPRKIVTKILRKIFNERGELRKESKYVCNNADNTGANEIAA